MFWCNRSRKERRSYWYAVTAPDRSRVSEAAAWCRQWPSTGKFYYHYTNTRWWFELESDAVMFSLRWS